MSQDKLNVSVESSQNSRLRSTNNTVECRAESVSRVHRGGDIQYKKVINNKIGTAEKFLDRHRRLRSRQVLGAASDVNTSVLIQRDCIHPAHWQAYRRTPLQNPIGSA